MRTRAPAQPTHLDPTRSHSASADPDLAAPKALGEQEATAGRQSATPTSGHEHGKNFGVRNREKTCAAAEDNESAARYLYERSHDVILFLDREGNILCINPRGIQLSGCSESELRGANIFERLLLPEDRPVFRRTLEDAVKGKARECEVRWRTKTGNIVHFAGTSVPRVSGAGEFLSTLCTLRDVTEGKRAEEALKESEERYRVLVEFSPNSICVHRDGKLLYVNPAGVRLFGARDSADLVGRSVLDFIHPDSLPIVRERLRRLQAGEAAPLIEEKFVTLNGEVRDVEVTAIPIVYKRAPASQVIIRDITDRKQGEALLAGEKRLLEMIATGVALKAILNALCLIIEEQRSGTLASVLLLNPDGVHLDCIAGPSLPDEWAQQMEKLPIGPCAGSCGTAAYRGSAVIASDIATDPLWDVPEHRGLALKHGLRASWSSPVLSSRGKVLGTFCMYYREPRAPDSQDLELIELATHLARVAIERDRAEAALRASEQLARGQVEALTYSLDVLATAPAPDKFLGQMLSTIGRLLSAQSVVLWLLDESNDSLVLRAIAQGANFATADPQHPFIKDPLLWKEDKVFQETVFTGAPVICEDVENDPRVSSAIRDYFKSKGTKKYLTIPTLVGGRVKGFIGIRHEARPPYRPEEIELAQALAHQAMLAIQLNEFAEQRREAAVLEERNRMARDIHDTLAQGFTGVIVQLEAAEDAIACCRRKEANDHLHRASELARRSLTEARRSVHALRPQALQRENFWEALKRNIKNTTAGTALHTTFKLRGKLRDLPPIWQENLLHIGQEALTNALKYARPRNFETRLISNPKQLRLQLRDDGDGFKVKDGHDGFGLSGMRERVEQMGGKLNITSSRGKGTKVTVTLPYNLESMS
jgi:PAS domain S-box-containing protein